MGRLLAVGKPLDAFPLGIYLELEFATASEPVNALLERPKLPPVLTA